MLSLVYETCRGVLYAKLTILIVNQSVKAVAPTKAVSIRRMESGPHAGLGCFVAGGGEGKPRPYETRFFHRGGLDCPMSCEELEGEEGQQR